KAIMKANVGEHASLLSVNQPMASSLEMTIRWQRWQQSRVSRRLLTPQAVVQGYTLLQVPAGGVEAFFALVDLLQARRHLEALPSQAEVGEAWQAWYTWTRRFAAYLERCAQHKPGTLPPVPVALATLIGGDDAGAR